MKTIYLLSFLLIFISSSAFQPQIELRKKEKFEQIIFGSGGGFTGMVSSFSLDNKGNLTAEKDKKKIKSVSTKKIKEITKKVVQSGVSNLSFNKPGNFYYFIEIQEPGKVNRVTWSDENKAPEKVILLYQYLIDLTK